MSPLFFIFIFMKPPYLKSGDNVIIISTARKVSKEEIQPSIIILESWGLKVTLGGNLFKEENQFSGSDLERTQDLQNALDDPNIKAIICARGGYGTVRIIDQIDFSLFQKHPKWLCGFSDVTVIHNAIHSLNISSLHSTMPLLFPKEAQKEAVNTLRNNLFGEPISYTFPKNDLNTSNQLEGVLIGGNLSIINNLIGTPSDIDTTNKVLFLEDLDEYLYHIDRMMQQLKRSGLLTELKGLLIGHMSDMNDNAIPFGKNAYEIILETVKEFNYPVIFNFPAGHLNRNLAIKLGETISVSSKGNEMVFCYA